MFWHQRRSRAESSVYWRQQIADWKKSGQKMRPFRGERNLTESQFHLWRRTLGVKPMGISARSVTNPTPAFVAMSDADLKGSPITLKLHGATLHVEPGVDVGLLRAVLQALKAS
jgi:hypothetical protein